MKPNFQAISRCWPAAHCDLAFLVEKMNTMRVCVRNLIRTNNPTNHVCWMLSSFAMTTGPIHSKGELISDNAYVSILELGGGTAVLLAVYCPHVLPEKTLDPPGGPR